MDLPMGLDADLWAAAARNNAIWCDAVARAHRAGGVFTTAVWLSRDPMPRFFPNLVTLDGAGHRDAHLHAIQRLRDSPPISGWAVKDSFAALELGALGFDPLFEARWIHRRTDPFAAVAGARRVADEQALESWELAWNGGASTARVFPSALLREQDHAVL